MKKGIDISQWQTNVDYSKLKKQGIEFAIIRCGYGRASTQKDNQFENHYKGLKKEGIKIGVYLYSYANCIQDGTLEAQNVLNFIKGKELDLPIFYDLEDKTTLALGRNNITEVAKKFCKVIQNAGYNVGIYANLNWFINYINLSSIKKDYPQCYVWLAQWEVETPTANFEYDFWQYTSKGKLDGISGNVDMDYEIRSTVENVEKPVDKRKSNEEIAKEVWQGLWGNGEERKNRLTNAGYDYTEIQKIVDKTKPTTTTTNTSAIKVGDKVKVLKAIQYNGQPFTSYYSKYDVIEVKGNRIVIGQGKTVTCAINVENLQKIS